MIFKNLATFEHTSEKLHMDNFQKWSTPKQAEEEEHRACLDLTASPQIKSHSKQQKSALERARSLRCRNRRIREAKKIDSAPKESKLPVLWTAKKKIKEPINIPNIPTYLNKKRALLSRSYAVVNMQVVECRPLFFLAVDV